MSDELVIFMNLVDGTQELVEGRLGAMQKLINAITGVGQGAGGVVLHDITGRYHKRERTGKGPTGRP